jgi:hypothetical protein
MNGPILVLETVCFLASLTLFFQVGIPSYLKLFTLFLLITIAVEYFVPRFVPTLYATILYNIFTAFEFEFYLYIIQRIIYSNKIKKVIYYGLWLYPATVLVNVFLIQYGKFHTITYSLGCLLTVAATIYYFFEIFRSPGSVNLLREPAFWICTALLFYYTCTFALVGLWNYLQGLPTVIYKNVKTILTVLNFLLYTLLSIAFLINIRVRKPAL